MVSPSEHMTRDQVADVHRACLWRSRSARRARSGLLAARYVKAGDQVRAHQISPRLPKLRQRAIIPVQGYQRAYIGSIREARRLGRRQRSSGSPCGLQFSQQSIQQDPGEEPVASPTHPRLLRFGTEMESHDTALDRVAAGMKFSFDLDLDAFFPGPGHLILCLAMCHRLK